MAQLTTRPNPFCFIQPCSPVTAKSVPAGDDWLHERKLAESLRVIPARSAILDAELCLPGRDDAPNFYALLARMHRRQHELAVYAFDLLQLDGEDLRPLPLVGRRRRLQRLLKRAKMPCLHLVEEFTDGQELLETTARNGLEGVVSKGRDAPYRSGECRDWRMVKTLAWREANRERWKLFEPG